MADWTDTIARRNAGDAPGFHAHDVPVEERRGTPTADWSRDDLVAEADRRGLTLEGRPTKAELLELLGAD